MLNLEQTLRQIMVVMDPIQQIKPWKDSTFALMLEAQRRGWKIFYSQQHDVFLKNGLVWATMRELAVEDNTHSWFSFGEETVRQISEVDAVFLRLDPPFNSEYLYTTYLLEQAEATGVKVVNKPQSVRDANEKLFATWFPHCCPPTVVTSQKSIINAFLDEHSDIICKPLDGMGGTGVFRLRKNDPNIAVILETITSNQTQTIMAQQYIPEVVNGDKRVLMVNGEPIPYALARIPAPGETRANLAAGGRGEGVLLTERDRWICHQVGPVLKEKGLVFVGLDIIGDYLTEINVTSPTCVRELERQFSINICAQWLDAVL